MIIKGPPMKLTDKNKALIESYARNLFGQALTFYVASGQDWKLTVNAIWGATIPTLIRWLNTNDTVFGRTK